MKITFQYLALYPLWVVFFLLVACQPQEQAVVPAKSETASGKNQARISLTRLIQISIRGIMKDARPPMTGSAFPPDIYDCLYTLDATCFGSLDLTILVPEWRTQGFNLNPPCSNCPQEVFKQLAKNSIPDFRKSVSVDAGFDWTAHTSLFPLTRSVVGLQFYAESKNVNRQTFTLQYDIALSADEQNKLGIIGKAIAAGTYPVVYNSTDNTYNALAGIR